MCGIGALLRPRASDIDLGALIGPFMDVVRHRGPDGEGFLLAGGPERACVSFAGPDTPLSLRGRLPQLAGAASRSRDATVALGHRRLSIVDVTAAGHQPMVSRDGRLAISYNGEIYNHDDLRRELALRGHVFASASDTEVLLSAYAEWGLSALSRLNGMFAFVLVDRARGVAICVRDRFAVKPLYLWQGGGGLVAVASEIKQFTTLPGFRARMNGARARDFLGWSLTDHTEETLFDGVRQLPGGAFLEIPLDGSSRTLPSPSRWYALRPGPRPRSYEEARTTVRELVLDSVRLRLRADVPVGIALSGGIDSSSIAGAAFHVLGGRSAAHRLQTFSACSHVERLDERRHIEPVAAFIDAETHYTTPDVSELFATLDRLAWHHDEPYGGTSVFAEWKVFELVRKTPVRVTLDGHGADELFAGYPTFLGPLLLELLLDGRWAELDAQLRAIRRRPGQTPARTLALAAYAALPDRHVQALRALTGRVSTEPRWFHGAPGAVGTPQDPYHRDSMRVAGSSRAQLLATSLPMQLKWADRDSMAHSIESRTPSLDYRLVEYVLGCPAEYKIRDGVQKAILRDAMGGLVPERTLRRTDKLGFVTAEQQWVQTEATQRFREELGLAFETLGPLLDETVRERCRDILAGREAFNLLLWRILCMGRWMRRFGVQAA